MYCFHHVAIVYWKYFRKFSGCYLVTSIDEHLSICLLPTSNTANSSLSCESKVSQQKTFLEQHASVSWWYVSLVCLCSAASGVSASLQPCGLQHTRHLCPWNSQEYWSELLCSPPEDLPHPGIKPVSLLSPALSGRFCTTSTTWEAHISLVLLINIWS